MKSIRVLAFLLLAVPLFGQYAGPALLTRGEAPSGMNSPQIHFRPFANILGIYQTGLAGVSVTEHGDLADTSSYGVSVGWGVSGTRSWRRTKVGLSYSGSVQHYVQRTAYDSVNQSLLLGIVHQMTRHIVLSVNESAGIYSRNMGLLGLQQTVPFDPATTYTPATDFFDNRTEYASTQVNLTVQRSARLSFNLGGNGNFVWRRSKALYGVRAGGATADVQYRLTRRSTVGAVYQFQHIVFTRVFGGTDFHAAAISYSVALSRRMEFSGFGGALRAESKFIESVPIDPAIAALLGITSSAQVAHSIQWSPYFEARLSRTFADGVAYLSAGHTISPGNGLFLTSERTSVLAGYSYTGLRRWSFSANAGYNRSNSVALVEGRYSDVSGALTASRQIARALHVIFNYTVREYQSGDFHNYNRAIHSVSLGIGFTPGDVPLRVW